MFMSNPAIPPTDQPKPSRSARLLALVRALIDHGRELAATLRERAATDLGSVRGMFGTGDLALILQRIARGLMRARALETRVIETAARLDKGRGRRPGSAPAHRQPRAVPAAARPAEAPDAPIELPTEEEIADWVRRRPIGAVLADICRDLGITCDHPLWRELQHAITAESGNYVRLVMDIVHRAARRVAEAWFPAAPATSIPPPLAGGG
jgi:hypothetical protein